MSVPDEGHATMDMKALFRAYTAPSHAEPTTLFHAHPETGEPPPALLRMWERHGVRDMFGVYATRALGDSFTIGIALPRATTPEIRAADWRARRQSWSAVARHLENALVVRDALAKGPSADFDLAGHGDFGGAAVEKRDELVETARQLEHERDAAHGGDPKALDAWSRLLKGEWSIIRYQRNGGRMRYLAVENPQGDTLRSLTPLECDVITRAAAGQSNKLMAAELELHLSTVTNVLATALRKLGLERRTHLPLLQSLLSTQR
jgi:DNA-binding CsgD family transcriptional regulator